MRGLRSHAVVGVFLLFLCAGHAGAQDLPPGCAILDVRAPTAADSAAEREDVRLMFARQGSTIAGIFARGALEADLKEHGCAHDAATVARVRSLLGRLERIAGQLDFFLHFAIIRAPTINAYALPGGYVGVYQGMIAFADSVARVDAKGSRRRRAELQDAYLAAVLSHELAHLTLGHVTDSTARACRALVSEQGSFGLAAAPPGAERELAVVKTASACLQFSQEQELAADAGGAMYLLAGRRQGEPWSLGAAEAFWRHQDRAERRDPTAYDPRRTRLLATHPRALARVNALERVRLRLSDQQVRFDDALSLIYSNVQLDAAVAMLDTVLADFPDLVAARQARAAAFLRQWLNTAAIQALQVRPTAALVEARFVEGVKGAGAGDRRLLSRARIALEGIPGLEQQPTTLANLAVLDAYQDQLDLAEQRARRAVALAPANPEVRNDLGVVLFLGEKYAEARAEFTQAITGRRDAPAQAVGEACKARAFTLRVLPMCFNAARALLAEASAAGDEARRTAALGLLRDYAALDYTDWRYEAARLAGVDLPRPAADSAAAPAPAPMVARKGERGPELMLGMAASEVRRALGAPAGADTMHLNFPARRLVQWMYPDSAGVAPRLLEGASLEAFFLRGEGWAYDGVAVGGTLADATARWGQPKSVRDDRADFLVSDTAIAVDLSGGRIVGIFVRAKDKFDH